MNRKITVVIASLLLIAPAVAAQVAAEERPYSSEIIELFATDLGRAEYEAAGFAKKLVTDGVEEFAIRVIANCPDGTIFIVRANDGQGNEADLGTVTMLFNSGSMTKRNTVDPTPSFALSKIKGVSVNERRGVILKGEFAE